MGIEPALYHSPKRKRGQEQPGPLVTTDFHNELADQAENHSPSTRVTGKFQKLGIESPLELGDPVKITPITDTTTITPPSELLLDSTDPPQPPVDLKSGQFEPPPSSDFTFSSDLELSPPEKIKGEVSTSNIKKSESGSPRSKSPPPSAVDSDLFWTESEITGYDPNDPDEDNYGINGVGYQQTPSVAWSLSQKRKQQIAEYRSRETKEARQRRSERRLRPDASGRKSNESSRPVSMESVVSLNSSNSDPTSLKKSTRFVRFDDG